jgi:hypothetical protein
MRPHGVPWVKESIVAKWSQWSDRARDPVQTRFVTAQPCRRDNRNHRTQNVRKGIGRHRDATDGKTPKSSNHGVVYGSSVRVLPKIVIA